MIRWEPEGSGRGDRRCCCDSVVAQRSIRQRTGDRSESAGMACSTLDPNRFDFDADFSEPAEEA
jgi:hypothetical protein